MKEYFSLDSIDYLLEKKFLDYVGGYFVELGGNDGINQSNTLYYERFRQWKGLIVEPILHNFFKCKINRPASSVYCNACVSFAYEQPYVELIYSDLMTTPCGVETDLDPQRQALIGSQFLNVGEEVVRTAAIARTLDSLLRNAKSPNYIDFLSLDVEGAEIEVLKGICFKTFQFGVMCIESRDSDIIVDFLNKYGYIKDMQIGHNLIFVHKNWHSSNYEPCVTLPVVF